LAENLFRSGSGSGRVQKSDPDLVKSRPDQQHWFPAHFKILVSDIGLTDIGLSSVGIGIIRYRTKIPSVRQIFIRYRTKLCRYRISDIGDKFFLCRAHLCMIQISVAEPHLFYAAPALSKYFDAALAPAHTLLHTKPTF
jgi:hypothetical protein